jgi:hypothetical protein
MAGHVRYTALLDACVLFPIAVADSLLSLATAGLFAAKWTQRIEREWVSNLEALRPTLKGKLETRRNGMREAVPDWEVDEDAWAPLVGNMKLPDPNGIRPRIPVVASAPDFVEDRMRSGSEVCRSADAWRRRRRSGIACATMDYRRGASRASQ